MYNETKQIVKNPGLWAPILGAINPATAVLFGVGAIITFAAIKIFKKDDKNKPLPTVKKPLETASQPLKQPLLNNAPMAKTTVQPYKENTVLTVKPVVNSLNDETVKKEMLRKIMSDLGKKSAAARARKRDQYPPE